MARTDSQPKRLRISSSDRDVEMTPEPQSPKQVHQAPADAHAASALVDSLSAGLRGSGLLGILATLVILTVGPFFEPLAAMLVLLWAVRSRTPWRELGFVRPRSWPATLTVGITFGIVFKLVMKSIVMPLLHADPINPAYQYLVGNDAAIPGMLFATIIGAGFGEETVYRGFLFERFRTLFGSGPGAKTTMILLGAVLFGAMHYPVQRLAGAEQAVITGLVFGVIFAMTGRIWMLMVAHATFDLTALAIIYWNLETRVAHLLFKS
jgi:membrane protease YdiL (CAAX protease family)